jgi:maltose phosphorylase
LDKAIENAKQSRFQKPALYPMVTMNGEECHNEWEITHEEIHRNGRLLYFLTIIFTGDYSIFLKRTRSFNWYCTLLAPKS